MTQLNYQSSTAILEPKKSGEIWRLSEAVYTTDDGKEIKVTRRALKTDKSVDKKRLQGGIEIESVQSVTQEEKIAAYWMFLEEIRDTEVFVIL